MATPLVLSTDVAQDIVRIQTEQISRLREQLEEALDSKARVSQELEVACENIRRLQNELEINSNFEEAKALCVAQHLSPVTSEAHCNPPISDDDCVSEVSDADETSSLATKDGPNTPLHPFCVKEGPWKYIRYLRQLHVLARGKNASKILPLGEEYVFNPKHFSKGYLVRPINHFVQNAQGDGRDVKQYKKWKSITGRRHELIVNHGPGWFYLGTYQNTSHCVLTKQEFEQLPGKAKRRVYTLTAEMSKGCSVPRKVMASMYSEGQLQVVKFDFRRIGYNYELDQGLFDAVASLRA